MLYASEDGVSTMKPLQMILELDRLYASKDGPASNLIISTHNVTEMR